MNSFEKLFKTMDIFAKIIRDRHPYDKKYQSTLIDNQQYFVYGRYCRKEFYDSFFRTISTVTFSGNEDKFMLTFGCKYPSNISYHKNDLFSNYIVINKHQKNYNCEISEKSIIDLNDWLNLHMIIEI